MTFHPSARAAGRTRGPVLPEERDLAPDLVRGAMLLFIALANAPGLAPGGPATDATLASLERSANVLLSLFVQARTYPVFAIMIGYGLVQLSRRQAAAGGSPAQVRSILLRRNLWLIAFGFVHAALLYFADFLGAYGIIGIVATYVLLGRPRIQRAILWIWAFSVLETIALAAFVLFRLLRGGGDVASLPIDVSASSIAPNYLASMASRLHEWPMHTLTVLPAIFIVCLGIWAAERRLLEDRAYLGLLRRIAIAGLSISIAGALPLALVQAGVVRADATTLTAISYLHKVSGMFGGPGYVALVALVANRVSRSTSSTTHRITRSLAALGQRSLSGYLFQSLAWLSLLAPFTLALGSRFGSPLLTSLAVAAIVWLLSVIGAKWLQRHARRGPAEVLLRRLVYGRPYRVVDSAISTETSLVAAERRERGSTAGLNR